MKKEEVIIDDISVLEDRKPVHVQVENTDLVVIKYDNAFSVLYGRCLHRLSLIHI